MSTDVETAVATVERVAAVASSADDLLEALSVELSRLVPHDASTWFGLDPLTLLATAPSRVESLDPAYCDTFWHLEFHEHDVGLFADLAREGGTTAMQLQLGDRVGRSARYRDFMRPQGLGDELRTAFRCGGAAWGVVSLYRDAGRAEFDEHDMAILSNISEPVAAALRTHVRVATPWLGQPSAPGLVVISGDGRVESANRDAVRWLSALWPLSDGADDLDRLTRAATAVNGQLVEVPTALHALVSRARAVADGRERSPARLRVQDRRGRWIVLHASTLEDGRAGRPSVAVVIEAAKSAEIAPIIIEAYSLTARERDVLAALAQGSSTSEIAAKLFISQHTVRDYIKTVFDKLGVSSRSELIARLFSEHYSDRLHDTMVEVH